MVTDSNLKNTFRNDSIQKNSKKIQKGEQNAYTKIKTGGAY
jgi:hypothetical protein